MIKLRKIRVKRLIWAGILYRCFVILCNYLFFLMGITYILTNFGPFTAALVWNGINILLYYFYHYWFLRFFEFQQK